MLEHGSVWRQGGMLLRRRLTGGYLDQGLVVSGHYDQILDIGSLTLFSAQNEIFSSLSYKA